jgi:hypothetical protein
MAERFPAAAAEEGERKSEVKCPLCPRVYRTSKSAYWHLTDNHKDAPELAEALKSPPKDVYDVCVYCGKEKTSMVQHKKTCSQNPNGVQPPLPPEQWPRMEEVEAELDRLEIVTDQEFFRDFVEYLTVLRGRSERSREECISLIRDFSRYQGERTSLGRDFSLTRLSFLYFLPGSGGLLLLPRPWTWLLEFQEEKSRDAALCAYKDLLDFLQDLHVKNGADHISQEYLEDVERDIESEEHARQFLKKFSKI